MAPAQINYDKQAIREHVWTVLKNERAVVGRTSACIPDFIGAAPAAARLAGHPAWRAAHVIKVVPDRAQFPVRVRALEEGKRVYMAAPKLAAPKPFYYLDPERLTVSPNEAADHHEAARFAQFVDLEEMPRIDLIVCGSVAVNYEGVRLGKGAGYFDIEGALLQEAGLIDERTLIATTVHPRQVLSERIPEAIHDFRIDVIVTPEEIIKCAPSRRPPGIIWENLASETISMIPPLAARKPIT